LEKDSHHAPDEMKSVNGKFALLASLLERRHLAGEFREKHLSTPAGSRRSR
jgi:hypothetical protein